MIGTGLIITTILCLGLSTNGVLNNSTPFLNQDKEQKEKNISLAATTDNEYQYNYTQNYTYNGGAQVDWEQNPNINPNDCKLTTQKYTANISTDIINLKSNIYATYVWWHNSELQNTTQNWLLPEETTNGKIQTSLLEIYQITNTRYTYDNNFTIEIGTNILSNTSTKITWKRNTYITTENLSMYIDLLPTVLTAPYYIANLEETLNNPNIGYQYTKYEDQITTNGKDLQYWTPITTEYNLIGTSTNYILNFYYLDQSIQENAIQTENLKYQQFLLADGTWLIDPLQLITTGKFIPPIENYEVIDIAGLMFQILTLPFSFISVAFNLTLFPGTMYQINLANLFLAVIGVLIFIFVINILIKRK